MALWHIHFSYKIKRITAYTMDYPKGPVVMNQTPLRLVRFLCRCRPRAPRVAFHSYAAGVPPKGRHPQGFRARAATLVELSSAAPYLSVARGESEPHPLLTTVPISVSGQTQSSQH